MLPPNKMNVLSLFNGMSTGHTALDNVGSQFQKYAILADLMGRAGVKLAVMGKDGAEGLLKMKQAGDPTFGQDEKTCVAGSI